MWNNSTFPEDKLKANIALIFKKGNPLKRENNRPISLLNAIYKIYASIIHSRLVEALDHEIQDTQFGFRKNRSTSDALFVAKRMQEYAERRGQKGLMILLDWEKAFDMFVTRLVSQLGIEPKLAEVHKPSET